MPTKFKSKAKFGKMANFVAKINFSILEISNKRGHTNGKWSNYELRKISYCNYGNLLQVLNSSLKGSTIDIINKDVRNRRGEKIMIFNTHEFHNNLIWDFGAHHTWVCYFDSPFLKIFKERSHRKFESLKVLMHISEEEVPEIGETTMGVT